MRLLLAIAFSTCAGMAHACDIFETLPRFSDPELLPPNYAEDIAACVAAIDDLQITNDFGRTPLSAAVGAEEPLAVAALIAAGADVEDGGTGYRPLQSAAISGLAQDIGRTNEIIQLLLNAGADVHADRGAALDSASSHNNAVGVRLLLEAGADPLTVNDIGQTPFYASLNGDADQGEIIAAMLKYGDIDPNLPIQPRDAFPLDLAASDNKTATLTALVAGGLDLNQANKRGRYPLEAISVNRQGAGDALRVLLDAGADPFLRKDKFKSVIGATLMFHPADGVAAFQQAGFDFATVPGDIAFELIQHSLFVDDPNTIKAFMDAGLIVPKDYPDLAEILPRVSAELQALFD